MKKKILINSLFILIAIIIFLSLQNVFTASNTLTEHAEMMMDGYYAEEENTVDVVAIGNSHIYRYWQGAFGWQQNGIASLSLSTSDMPCTIFKNMGIEALKTQKPKVLVLDALAFADGNGLKNNKVYYVTCNMRFSSNYLDTVKSYCDTAKVEGFDRLAYYLPLLRFHTRWSELKERDFKKMRTSYLNSCYEKDFLKKTIEMQDPIVTEQRLPIHEGREASLRELLEWCKQQDVQIEFIAVPTLLTEERLAMVNYVGDIIEEYDIPFINYNTKENFESCGFIINEDFQDINHTNVKGSYKFCNVYGKHLMEVYGVEDRREDPAYASWEERSQQYFKKIKKYFSI